MSILTTFIARVSDGLMLSGSMVDERLGHDLDNSKLQAKKIIKQLGPSSPPTLSIDTGPYFFQSARDLAKQFHQQYGKDVERASRPYAFVAFDLQIQKTKRQYADLRSQRLEQLHEDLQDVRSIMTKNITEVLGRGERLDSLWAVQDMSTRLKEESGKFKVGATQLRELSSLKRFWPIASVTALVIVLLVIRFKFL